MKTKLYTTSFQCVLAAVLVIFLNFSANAQCTNGSFSINNGDFNLPIIFNQPPASSIASGSTSYSGCSQNVTVTAEFVGGATGNTLYVDPNNSNRVDIRQYGEGTSITTFKYTFSSPISLNELHIWDIDRGGSHYRDKVAVSVNNGATITITEVYNEVEIVSGNGTSNAVVQATNSSTANDNGGARFKTTGTITELLISYSDNNPTSGERYIYIDSDMSICCPPACSAGTTAPTMEAATNFDASTNTYTIPCGSTTVDLNSLTASNLPAGTSLTWHSGTPATGTNKITGSLAGPDTYYAAFYDSANDCYSPTTVVTVIQETNCCNAGNTAPTIGQ